MPYTKTQWVDNDTDIDKDNLNKIEQGIYDNSLVVDAVTNTLNPTDTETYKTAELTEGQITDVIGISDIVIKGQTSQDGTPTPSAPVDVNVVSGSNVINTSNKNWLKTQRLTTKTLNGITFTPVYTGKMLNYINVNGTATATTIYEFEDVDIGNPSKYISKLSAGSYILSDYSGTSSSANSTYIRYTTNGSTFEVKNSVSDRTFTLSQDCKYVAYIRIQSGSTFSNMKFKPQLEKSSTATTYEPHQGKELHLDLGKNLANIDDIQLQKNWQNVADTTRASIVNIKVKPSTTYTLSSSYTSSSITNVRCVLFGAIGDTTHKGVVSGTFTTTSTTHYLSIEVIANTTFTQSMLNGLKIQLEKGDTATEYVPYDPDPIELCKIGNYQDYFYKSGSKWYLHKETIKTIINGSADQTILYSNLLNALVYTNSNIANVSQSSLGNIICNKAVEIARNTVTTNNGICLNDEANRIVIKFDGVSSYNTEALAREYFANNPYEVIYKASTTTNTEITDTILISQLEAIYNAPLYEQTNITQENNDLPMVLDITACKDNINGIKAFIRK